MAMVVLAILVVLPTWWAMGVRLAASGQGGVVCQLKAAAFALFQLAVMVALIAADAWWAMLMYALLMLATGNMLLEAVSQHYPDSRLGAGWARQKAASEARNK